LVVHFLTQW